VSAVVGFGDITAAFNYTDMDRPAASLLSGDHTAIGLGYTFDAYSLHINYGQFDFDDGTDADGVGLSVGYDLGGGASMHFGYGSGDTRANLDVDTWSFGVAMSF
jgi:outer membrane protein OmpU